MKKIKKFTRRLAAIALGTTLMFTAVSGVSADTYTVKKGDTLSGIAKQYNISYKTIMQDNKLKTTSIKVGQKLKVNAKKTTTAKKATTKKTYTTTAALNLRASKSTKAKIYLTIPKGKAVTYISKSGNWYKVKYSGKTGWVSSQYIKVKTTTSGTTKAAASTTKATDMGNKIVKEANKYLGTRYVYGGTTPSGFDCSGFVYYVYNKAGKSIARNTAAGYYSKAKKVSNPQVGDLVFFAGTYGSGISHVGIYIGNGKMIDASGTKVQTNSVTSGYWKSYLVGYGRL